MHTLLHFGQTKVWADDDLDAARSFCLLQLSFVASCRSALNLQLAFFFFTDERQMSWSQPSCCHMQALSSAGLCNAFLEHHDCAFLLGAC